MLATFARGIERRVNQISTRAGYTCQVRNGSCNCSMESRVATQRVQPVSDTQRAVLVAIPALDEDRFIGSLVLKLRANGHTAVVVDDGSTDATAEVAEAAGAIVIRHPHNR